MTVSQGSVATYASCDGIFSNQFTANVLKNLPVKKKLSVEIWQNYGYEFGVSFFGQL